MGRAPCGDIPSPSGLGFSTLGRIYCTDSYDDRINIGMPHLLVFEHPNRAVLGAKQYIDPLFPSP